jgi:preprotein translocase subunit SecG
VQIYLHAAMIVISIALIGVILLQSKGAGLGGLGGGQTSGGTSFHVRRGVERLLFNITIGLSALFFVLAIVSVMLG